MGPRLSYAGPDRFRLAQNSDINVTPFVDVMMVLLIIFMVALPAATTSLKLDLPPSEHSGAATQPTIINLQRDGRLYIGESPTTLAALSADLKRLIGSPAPRGPEVYVRAEKGVRYGAFVAVVNRLHNGGYQKVGLVNEEL